VKVRGVLLLALGPSSAAEVDKAHLNFNVLKGKGDV
jgi:hypothetical protein